MELNHIAEFLAGSLGSRKSHWSSEGISAIAGRIVPDGLLGLRSGILRADINLVWARWFAESLCGPSCSNKADAGYAFLFDAIRTQIDQRFGAYSNEERNGLSKIMARFVLEEVGQTQLKRKTISKNDRITMLDFAGETPRCWICGFAFEQPAIDTFLGAARPTLLRTYVDFAKPRLVSRDYLIEVDHKDPFAEGGGGDDNLALACGWCNKIKGARRSLYDVRTNPLLFDHPRLGATSVPHPFWIVRLIAIRGQCEEQSCQRKVSNHELTVQPRLEEGAMNPMNIMVTCPVHDRYGEERLVERVQVELGTKGLNNVGTA
jgi:hypothetical protein